MDIVVHNDTAPCTSLLSCMHELATQPKEVDTSSSYMTATSSTKKIFLRSSPLQKPYDHQKFT